MSLLIKALKKAEKDNQSALEEDLNPAFDLQLEDNADPGADTAESPSDRRPQGSLSRPEAAIGSAGTDQAQIQEHNKAPNKAADTELSDLADSNNEPVTTAPGGRAPLAFADEQDSFATPGQALEIPRHAPDKQPVSPPEQPALQPLGTSTQPQAGSPDLPAPAAGDSPAAQPTSAVPKAQPMSMPQVKKPNRGLVGGAIAVVVVALAAWAGMQMLQGQENLGDFPDNTGMAASGSLPLQPPVNQGAAAPGAQAEARSATTPTADTKQTSAAQSESAQSKNSEQLAKARTTTAAAPGKRARENPPVASGSQAEAVRAKDSTGTRQGQRSTSSADSPAMPPVRFVRRESVREQKLSMLNDAYRALRAGQLAQAQAVYSEALKLDRNLSDAWIGLASIAARAGDNVLAEQHYQQALRINPNDSVAQAGLATLAEDADPVDQESRLRNLAARSNGDAAVQFALGNTLAGQGRWAEAQQAYFQASAAEPAQPDYAFNLAISLEHMRQPAAAITHYQRAIEAARTAPASFDPTKAQTRIDAIRARGVDQ